MKAMGKSIEFRSAAKANLRLTALLSYAIAFRKINSSHWPEKPNCALTEKPGKLLVSPALKTVKIIKSIA